MMVSMRTYESLSTSYVNPTVCQPNSLRTAYNAILSFVPLPLWVRTDY